MRALHMMLSSLWLAASLAFASPASVTRDVAVPMRDGVRLQADVLLPAETGRFPTLVYRTPYDRKPAREGEVVRRAVAGGYAVVLQDVRGRYGSEGDFVPYVTRAATGTTRSSGRPLSRGRPGRSGLSVCRTPAPCSGSRRWNPPRT